MAAKNGRNEAARKTKPATAKGAFHVALKRERKARGHTTDSLAAACDLEARLGVSDGAAWLRGVEAGKSAGPPREICNALEDALGLSRDYLWHLALEDERKVSEDVRRYYEEQINRAEERGQVGAAGDLTDDEAELLAAVRRLDVAMTGSGPEAWPFGAAGHLAHLVNSAMLSVKDDSTGRDGTAARLLGMFLRRVRYAQAPTVHDLLGHLASLITGDVTPVHVARVVRGLSDDYINAPRQPWADPAVEEYRRPND